MAIFHTTVLELSNYKRNDENIHGNRMLYRETFREAWGPWCLTVQFFQLAG